MEARRILVADDDQDVRGALRVLLELPGRHKPGAP